MNAGKEMPAENGGLAALLSAGEFDRVAEALAAVAVEAGAIVMEVFAGSRIATRLKNDSSPVCDADERTEAFLLDRLARLAPEIPVVAEESAAKGNLPPPNDAFLLVDPLDGTREFVAHGKEFTINIALIVDRTPRAGAVYAPALERLWVGGNRAFAACVTPGAKLPPHMQWHEMRCRKAPREGLVALSSRSHLDRETRAFLARQDIRERREEASSLKFCELAGGSADVYPRFSPTMEWDTAAGDAILRAAGGLVLTPENEPFLYGKSAQGYRNGAFIAWGDPKRATES
jgi:3'(2'), 5'-bisphosphate nucleotidase